MRFRPEAGIGLAVLALVAAWPFWQAHGRDSVSRASVEPAPDTVQWLPDQSSSVVRASAGPSQRFVCSGCGALKRLARRLQAREEGAARRFEAAASRLSATGPEASGPAARRELELALRRAQDDKRGAAAFRAATLEALRACESGPGCGQTALSAYWDEGCPPEEPDLGRETRLVASLSRVLARKAGACAAAACPDIDCRQSARIIHLLSAADRNLKALVKLPESTAKFDRRNGNRARALLKESEDWRRHIAALFMGGPEPSAQIEAAAEAANALSERLAKARAAGSEETHSGPPAPDPYWRLHVLSIRLERAASALTELASALRSEAAGRDAALFAVRQKAANALRDLLITQMRIRSAREHIGASPAGPDVLHRCAIRRRDQIARARGQIRALRTALGRCSRRAACLKQAKHRDGGPSTAGLDPVSAYRVRLDRTFAELEKAAPAFNVEGQGPVEIDTVRPRYESGEAVSVRMDLRAAACMADDGSWVGLFPGHTPILRGSEIENAAFRRLNLRGRPWEEVLFEAPPEPGKYEVRTYASERRGGSATGRAQFEVAPRQKGCRGFSGTWRTNFGRLQITVRDGEARGSYKRQEGWRAGFLTGKVNGRVLLGEWQSDLGAGGTRLVLSEDGKSLSGTWSHFRDEFAGTGVWNGTCEGPVKPPVTAEKG